MRLVKASILYDYLVKLKCSLLVQSPQYRGEFIKKKKKSEKKRRKKNYGICIIAANMLVSSLTS